jgi:hypothetical protein
VLNRTQNPGDVFALMVLWRLRYRLTLQDLGEMFFELGSIFSPETVRDREAKLAPALTAEFRQRRVVGGRVGRAPVAATWGFGVARQPRRRRPSPASRSLGEYVGVRLSWFLSHLCLKWLSNR